MTGAVSTLKAIRIPATLPAQGAPWLSAALGLLSIAQADINSRSGARLGYLLFWLGIALIAGPVLWRSLASPGVGRTERLNLSVLLGCSLFAAKLLYSPQRYVFHDEYAHYRTAVDLMSGHGLFSLNPEIRVASHYPGLAVATTYLSVVTGLSIFASGVVVLLACRIAGVLALFLLVERLTGSDRAGATAVLVYAGNPNFLFWQAQFAYESFALPLALTAIYLLASREFGDRRVLLLAGAISASVTVSHHITSAVLALLFLMWAVLGRLRRDQPARPPLAFALAYVALTALWIAFAAPQTLSYLVPVVERATTQGLGLITGSSPQRALFANEGGNTQPPWEQYLAYAAVATNVCLIVIGLRRSRRASPLVAIIAWSAAVWALLLPLRLTPGGQETANRSGDFLFVGIGLCAALALSVKDSGRQALRHGLAAAAAAIVLAGGISISWSYAARLPPDPAALTNPVVTTPQADAAAAWLLATYGPHKRIATDVTSGLAFTAHDENTLSGASFGSHIWRIFEPRTMTAGVWREIGVSRVQFIVVQRRLEDGIPSAAGVPIFDSGEPSSVDAGPMPAAALTKFAGAAGITQVYSSSEISIFRVMKGAQP